jgi:hypothetical protein
MEVAALLCRLLGCLSQGKAGSLMPTYAHAPEDGPTDPCCYGCPVFTDSVYGSCLPHSTAGATIQTHSHGRHTHLGCVGVWELLLCDLCNLGTCHLANHVLVGLP